MSGYRDDHEAAVQRAEALERELALAKAKLVERERALVAKDRAIATQEQALADQERVLADKDRALADVAAAQARLDALRRAPRRAPDGSPPTLPQTDVLPREPSPKRRIFASLLWHGDLLFSWTILGLALPIFAISFLTVGRILVWLGAPESWLLVGAFGPWTSIVVLPLTYLPFKYRYLLRWARTRGYELGGYPEVLGAVIEEREDARLRVRLQFVADAPADLDAILRGFDAEITMEPRGWISRPCPTTDQRLRPSKRISHNATTCWPIHAWIRRFERTVLRPLHAAHGLACVEIVRSRF